MIKKIIAFFAGFVSVFVFVACISESFWYYAKKFTGINIDSKYSFIALLTAVISIMYLVSTQWKLNKNDTGKTWIKINEIDYVLCIIATACSFYLGYISLTSNNILYGNPIIFFISPFIAYCFSALLLLMSVWRFRNKTLNKTIYLIRFYNYYPVYTAVGFTMTILYFGNIILLFYFANNRSIALFLFNVFALITLSLVFKAFSRLSVSYDKVLADKIKSEQFKTELITNVSHDIKTPLTSIINYVDLIKKLQIKNEALSEYTDVLDKKSSRLKMLIEDLIEASKVGTGNISVNITQIDINELIGQISGEFDELFSAYNLTFIYKQSEDTSVLADGRHLYRVMENLFANAAKYSMDNTRIYAEVIQKNEKVVFSLKNISKEPLGISAEQLTEQFVRGDRSRHTEGSGLGLYIAKSLTELMNGSFEIVINGDLFEIIVTLNKPQG